MNRNNKILVGVLAFIVAMTIGYALFSDKITITGTAKAKGDFSVTATCNTGIDSKLGIDPGEVLEGGYKNDSCSVNDNDVTMNVDFLYPSATRYFTVKMTNNGTIDAELDTNKISSGGKVCSGTDVSGNDKECRDFEGELGSIGSVTLDFYQIAGLFFIDKDGLIHDQYDPESSDWIDENGVIRIKPSESMYIIFQGQMDEEFGSGKSNSLYITYNITYTLPWQQVTTN